jgi:hypothetical protein
MSGRELGGLNAQRDAFREQFVGIARGVFDEPVSTPFLARPGMVATTLRLTSAGASFNQSVF